MPTAPPRSSVGLRMLRGRPRCQIATGKLADFPKRFSAHRPRLRPLGVRPAANKAAYASALRPRRLSIPGSKAIRAFRETFPMVSLVLEEGLSNEVVARFNNDQMDVAFVLCAFSARARFHTAWVIFVLGRAQPPCLLYPDEPTSSVQVLTSERCQKRLSHHIDAKPAFPDNGHWLIEGPSYPHCYTKRRR